MRMNGWLDRWEVSGKHRVFIRLLIPYLLVMLIPLLLGWLVYNKSLAVMEKEAVKGMLGSLEQSKQILETRLTELDSIMQQLVWDPKINGFRNVTKPFHGANTYRVLETRGSLYDHSVTNNFILDYFVVFKNSNLALSVGRSYPLPYFYKHVLNYDGMAYEDWRELVFGEHFARTVLPARPVLYEGKSYEMVTELQSFGYPGNVLGSAVIVIDNQQIQKLLEGLDFSSGGWAAVVDEEGSMISGLRIHSEDPLPVAAEELTDGRGVIRTTVDATKMMIAYTTSKYNGWTYMAAQPVHAVLEKVNYIKKTTFLLTFLFLSLGVTISYVMAYRTSKPLRTIIHTIREKMGSDKAAGKDAFRLIGDAVSGLIEDNRQLQVMLKRQAPLLRASFFERLLKGEWMSDKDAEAHLLHLGIDWLGRPCVVTIVDLSGRQTPVTEDWLEETDVNRIFVKELLRDKIGENGYMHDMAEHQIVIIYMGGEGCTLECCKQWAAKLNEADRAIIDRLGIAPVYGVGNGYDSILQAAHSYEEAKKALHSAAIRQEGKTIVWHRELTEEAGYGYYPDSVERKLFHLASAGDKQGTVETLEGVYEENFVRRRLSPPMLRLLIYQLWGTAMKAADQVSLSRDEIFEAYQLSHSRTEGFEGITFAYRTICRTFEKLCDEINDRKKSQNVLLLENMLSYIQASYGRSDLCLDGMSSDLQMNKVYLSQFFKEQTGVNFSDYVERLRMDKARELLKTTELPVNEIAVQTGYNSANTFCRAFKRINGLSTTDYRRSASLSSASITSRQAAD
ncbi:helix-turn-helix domain-containing protein [Paenibacillus sp. J2TS4]|uniref:helix-turn-helix domain-containing protein n=1 Tax=Paenibacillus sp. J2TS4 TaxID=2807194 RepID=UPI001B13A4B3|nr:helix-turn-helix domain-containing protein [Paenibacillus sp. J2TS4]GIP32560.1 hypothetical protein J2TS4_17700 [Paenibacillus sp. J2TS4]